MNRQAVNAWLQMKERNVFFRRNDGMAWIHSSQIPFEVPGRTAGRQDGPFSADSRLALTGISAFSSLPLQFVTVAGLFFLSFSIIFWDLYACVAGGWKISQRFRHSYSATSHHWEPVNDKSWYHRRVPGAYL